LGINVENKVIVVAHQQQQKQQPAPFWKRVAVLAVGTMIVVMSGVVVVVNNNVSNSNHRNSNYISSSSMTASVSSLSRQSALIRSGNGPCPSDADKKPRCLEDSSGRHANDPLGWWGIGKLCWGPCGPYCPHGYTPVGYTEGHGRNCDRDDRSCARYGFNYLCEQD